MEKLGASIGKSVVGQKTGKTQSIIQQVNAHNLSQADSVIVIKAAFEKGLGLRTFINNQTNGTIIVSSVMLGRGKPVIVVGADGQAHSAKADILLSGFNITVTNVILDP